MGTTVSDAARSRMATVSSQSAVSLAATAAVFTGLEQLI